MEDSNEMKNQNVDKPNQDGMNMQPNDGKLLNFDANSLDIGVWGVSVVLGGALYGWNAALVTGFGMYSLAQGLIRLAMLNCFIFVID